MLNLNNKYYEKGKTSPFTWQNKNAIREIQEKFDRKKIGSILLTYFALSMFSSNKNSINFNCFLDEIAILSGLSTKTTSKCLKNLASLNIIRLKKGKRNVEGRYDKMTILMFDRWHVLNKKVDNIEKEGGGFKNNNNNINNEKTKIDDNQKKIVDEILKYWNEKDIIKHRFLDEKHQKIILKVLENYTLDEIKKGIDNYNKVIKNNDIYYYDFKWVLVNFLSNNNGLEKFLNSNIDEFKKKSFEKAKPSNFLSKRYSKEELME